MKSKMTKEALQLRNKILCDLLEEKQFLLLRIDPPTVVDQDGKVFTIKITDITPQDQLPTPKNNPESRPSTFGKRGKV